MPNPFFQFKQFKVHHDRCAMKVGTDGVLLGACASVCGAACALDIGTGTGLIALMLAQRNPHLHIDAIEIDENASIQAKENADASPFATRVAVTHSSLAKFAMRADKQYDLIVCNPPFFSRSLKSPDEQRTKARHDDSLPVEDLIATSVGLLSPSGRIAIVYPFSEKELLIRLAQANHLFVSRIVNVYPTSTSIPKRILIEYSNAVSETVESDLLIETSRHMYSDEFTALVKDFYLKM